MCGFGDLPVGPVQRYFKAHSVGVGEVAGIPSIFHRNLLKAHHVELSSQFSTNAICSLFSGALRSFVC